MSSAPTLSVDDLCFINLVASRRYAAADPVQPMGLDAALEAASTQPLPFARAAGIAYELLARRVFATAPLPTALLAMVAQLDIYGRQLLAPQGAIVGMMRELQDGSVDAATIVRWLEDRAVPSSSGF